MWSNDELRMEANAQNKDDWLSLNRLNQNDQASHKPIRMNDDSPEYARITTNQALLFPQSAWEVCKEIGLDPWAASKLHDDGWLSFDPETTNSLSEQQECELRFVSSLVTGGLSPRLLPEIVQSLEKPYCYEGRKIYYDWANKRWRLLPQAYDEVETLFDEWVEDLVDAENTETLEELQEKIQAALKYCAS